MRNTLTTLTTLVLATVSAFATGCGAGAGPMVGEHPVADAGDSRVVAASDPSATDVPSAVASPVLADPKERWVMTPAAIAAKKQRAWVDLDVDDVDCSRGAKICTAKGFDYDKASPAMPEINARAAAPGH